MWPISLEGFRHNIAATPERARPQRLVAERDGTIVAWGVAYFAFETSRTDVGFAGTVVTPAARRRRLGSELFERSLEHLRGGGAVKAVSDAWQDDGRRFLERRGFVQTFERRLSALDPREVDATDVAHARTTASEAGYEIVPFSACQPEEVFTVDAITTRDIPMDEPMTDLRFDEWLQRHWGPPQRSLDGSLAVRAAGEVVAVTFLRLDEERQRAWNDMTGTLPAHRGRGLARLLKLVQAEWLAARGVTRVITENDETNRPMLAVNERLGFRPIGSVFSYAREPL
jgi:GNAT superfamily N-acetyltransferase